MVAADFAIRLDKIYSDLRAGAAINSKSYEWRVEQLKALQRLITENEAAICEALWKDLHKPQFESTATEYGIVLSEIECALKNLKKWMKPKKYWAPLYNQPGSCEVRFDALGLALVIGAWNYPINLLLCPVVAAIAGGNSVIMKPSEMTAATAKLIADLVPKYLCQKSFAVIQGGPDETDLLLDKPFDTIFFTGSGKVGKIVMGKAAKNLTPVTLELGGKSPAIVLADADIAVAAKRIAWGKFMNGGQTCVAPDYVLVQPSVKDQLVAEMKKALHGFYGEDAQKSGDYCRIVNERNLERLAKMLEGEKILHGGKVVKEDLYIEPTLLDTNVDRPVMEDEIFGPILPIIAMNDLPAMVKYITSKPHPLSLYAFTSDSAIANKILQETTSGGACINDVVMHMPVHTMPFGGVGASGMGHYHGEYGFQTFTHAKAVLRKATWIDIALRYAPYKKSSAKLLEKLL